MSNIIKANNFLLIQAEDCTNGNSIEENFTQNNTDAFYQEAKILIEELITEAKAKAERILEKAQLEADDILTAASQQAETIKKEAYLEGYRDGEKTGLLDTQNLKNQANSIIQLAYAERKKIIDELENEIIDFTIKIAEKILRCQLQNNKEIIVQIAQDLLVHVQDCTQVKVKVSPVDYDNLEKQTENLRSVLNYGVLNLEIDNSLNQGDCIIISETGIVLAKIDEQLEKLQNSLREGTDSD